MAFEDSIAKIAADISDAFAEDISRSLQKIISEEKDCAYQELQIPTVRTNCVRFFLHLRIKLGQPQHPNSKNVDASSPV
jgi:hypothetical protein